MTHDYVFGAFTSRHNCSLHTNSKYLFLSRCVQRTQRNYFQWNDYWKCKCSKIKINSTFVDILPNEFELELCECNDWVTVSSTVISDLWTNHWSNKKKFDILALGLNDGCVFTTNRTTAERLVCEHIDFRKVVFFSLSLCVQSSHRAYERREKKTSFFCMLQKVIRRKSQSQWPAQKNRPANLE